VECVIGNIPRRVGYGSEKFRLVPLHNCYIGFVGATPQFNSIGPYREIDDAGNVKCCDCGVKVVINASTICTFHCLKWSFNRSVKRMEFLHVP